MAQALTPRFAPSMCTQSPYAHFLPLKDFYPAVKFCSSYQAQSTMPSVSDCPKGNVLCSILSSLSTSDRTFVSDVCSCIGLTVPSATQKTTLATSKGSGKKTTTATTATTATTETTATTATAAPTTTAPSGPTCIIALDPPPGGNVCQQRGTVEFFEETFIVDPVPATSVEECVRRCFDLDPSEIRGYGCGITQFDTDTGICTLAPFTGPFTANPDSLSIVTENSCFVRC